MHTSWPGFLCLLGAGASVGGTGAILQTTLLFRVFLPEEKPYGLDTTFVLAGAFVGVLCAISWGRWPRNGERGIALVLAVLLGFTIPLALGFLFQASEYSDGDFVDPANENTASLIYLCPLLWLFVGAISGIAALKVGIDHCSSSQGTHLRASGNGMTSIR